MMKASPPTFSSIVSQTGTRLKVTKNSTKISDQILVSLHPKNNCNAVTAGL